MTEPDAVFEIEVDGTKVAWLDNNEVYVYDPGNAQRDDGFKYVGDLDWLDEMDANTERLSVYIKTLLAPQTPESFVIIEGMECSPSKVHGTFASEGEARDYAEKHYMASGGGWYEVQAIRALEL